MRKELLSILCVTVLLLVGVTTANAGDITWNMLTHSSIANEIPGTDLLVGHAPRPTGDNCNLNFTTNCETNGTADVGSYSFVAIEIRNDLSRECLEGGAAGGSCVCADPAGLSCSENSDCTAPQCGSPDCCPGGTLPQNCLECVQDDSGAEIEPGYNLPYDTYTYYGKNETLIGGRPGTITTCEGVGSTGKFAVTDFSVNSTQSIPDLGFGCIELSGGPYEASACTGAGGVSGTLDVDFFVLLCAVAGDTVNDIVYTGDVIDITGSTPDPTTASCGYTDTEVATLASHAKLADPNAKYLMVLCGDTHIPDTSPVACLGDALLHFVVVAYTTSDQVGNCPGDGC